MTSKVITLITELKGGGGGLQRPGPINFIVNSQTSNNNATMVHACTVHKWLLSVRHLKAQF